MAHKKNSQTNEICVPRRQLPDEYDTSDQETETKDETTRTSRTASKSSSRKTRKVDEPQSQEMNGNAVLEQQTEKTFHIPSTSHRLFIEAFVDLGQVARDFGVNVKFNKATYTITICGSAADAKLAYEHIKSITKSLVSQPVDYSKEQVIRIFNSDEGEAFLREEAANNETVIEKKTTFTWKCGKINVTGTLVEDRFDFSSSINKKLTLKHSDLDGTKMDMKFKLAKNDSNKGGRFSGKSIEYVAILLDGSIDDLQDAFVTAMRQVAASRVDNVAFLLSSVAGLALKDIINYVSKYFIGWLLKASPDNVVQVVLCVTRREEFREASATLSETLDKWFESKTKVANLAPIIVKGELDKTVADVLVNTTSPDLDFSSGQVSSALLKQAGKKLKKESKKTYKNGIGHGEVGVTDGYGLDCKKVFHISLPPYDKTAQEKCYKYVVDLVGQCLRKANEFEYKSIAFPAIGTGKLGYPEDILISMLFTGVEKFKEEIDSTSLEDVQFVVFPREEDLVYLFETLGCKFIRGKSEPTKFEKDSSMKITITGSKENVENTKSDIERYQVDPNEMITERLFDVYDMHYRAIEELFGDLLTTIKEKGFEIKHNKKKNLLEFKGRRKTVKSIQELLEQLKSLHQRIFTLPPGLDQKLIHGVLSDNRLRNNGVYLALDSDMTGVHIFATTEETCDKALEMVTKRLKKTNLQPQQKHQKNSVRRLDEGNPTESGLNCTTKELPTQKTEKAEHCVICMDEVTEAKRLKCGHTYCRECIDGYFRIKQVCPTCGKVCGVVFGDQPDGTMLVKKMPYRLTGYERKRTVAITYEFQDGRQGLEHPRPGTPYKGIQRTAYLPDNTEGREICAMLTVAFQRRLVFTIGTSRTTGKEGVITWNDIHHKTDLRPNRQFGYPDATYLQRVREELEIKGVTKEDVDGKLMKDLKKEDFTRVFRTH